MSAQTCGCDVEAGYHCERHLPILPISWTYREINPPHPPLQPLGDPRFHALLQQLGELHDRKQRDYGSSVDPFANVRASADWGIPGWIGCMTRLTDKVKRLQKLAKTGTLANEAAEDSFMDIAVYALIGLILYREQTQVPSCD